VATETTLTDSNALRQFTDALSVSDAHVQQPVYLLSETERNDVSNEYIRHRYSGK